MERECTVWSFTSYILYCDGADHIRHKLYPVACGRSGLGLLRVQHKEPSILDFAHGADKACLGQLTSCFAVGR